MSGIRRAWRHPMVRGAVYVVAFVAVAEVLVFYTPLAWAATKVQITDRITVDLGDLPQWVIALVAAGGLWKAWRAEQKAADAAAKAAAGVAKIEAVSIQIDGLLAERDKAKVIEGEAKGKKAGDDTAKTLAEGQRQGREVERASSAAKTPGAVTPAATAGGETPFPVADDRTAKASERVAEATERSADAQQRVAKVTETKKGK